MENQTYNNLIYRSIEKDRQSRSLALKTRSCTVEYYTTHKLEPLDILVGELLLESANVQLECVALGRALGFDVEAQPENGMYYDEAENKLFHKFLHSVHTLKNRRCYSPEMGSIFYQNHSLGHLIFLVIKFIIWVDCSELNLSLVFIFIPLIERR